MKRKRFVIRGSIEDVDDVTGIRVSFRDKATGKYLAATDVGSNGLFRLDFIAKSKRIDGILLFRDTHDQSGNFTIGGTSYDFDDKVRREFKASANKINRFDFSLKRNERTQISSSSPGTGQNQCCAYSGRFITFASAARGREEALGQGYSVSPVLGVGGILSSWSQREYYFRYCGIC